MKNKNKIGIMCDNHKLEKFKKELDKAGFTYEATKMGAITLIKVDGTPEQQPKVHAICINVEAYFNRKN